MRSRSPRSYLYVPADQNQKLEKAANRGADALIIDLEDSVSILNKEYARTNLVNFLNNFEGDATIWVRVNNNRNYLLDDLFAAVHPKVTGISFPKSESSDQLFALDEEILKLENKIGTNKLQVLALIESAKGVVAANQIALSPRVTAMQLGEQDLSRELRLPSEFLDPPLAYARNAIIYASAMAGLMQPVGSVATQYSNLESLRESTQAIRRLGFFGRTCIHPAQVGVVNEIFSTDEGEVRRAQRIIELMEASNGGAAIFDDGSMIDQAHLKWARSILEE